MILDRKNLGATSMKKSKMAASLRFGSRCSVNLSPSSIWSGFRMVRTAGKTGMVAGCNVVSTRSMFAVPQTREIAGLPNSSKDLTSFHMHVPGSSHIR